MSNSDTQVDTSTGGSKAPTFKEENLTLRAHLDPDKHWIGETLPAGSDAETRPSGIETKAGNSPFPARADHSHDTKTYYSTYITQAALFVPPGQSFMSNLSFYSGRNMLAAGSNQVIIFPLEGIWQVAFCFIVERGGGGNFVGEFNIVNYYTNGGYGRYVYRTSMFDLPGTHYGTAVDHVHYFSTDVANNVQIAIQHNDTANWYVHAVYVDVTRIHSSGSA